MLIDPYKRPVNYLRVSVTDRCDFRCQYCMSENMTFLPQKDLLSLEEIERICTTFINLGTKKIRITGGEPLVRKNVMGLFKNLGTFIDNKKLPLQGSPAGYNSFFTAKLNSNQVDTKTCDVDSDCIKGKICSWKMGYFGTCDESK